MTQPLVRSGDLFAAIEDELSRRDQEHAESESGRVVDEQQAAIDTLAEYFAKVHRHPARMDIWSRMTATQRELYDAWLANEPDETHGDEAA